MLATLTSSQKLNKPFNEKVNPSSYGSGVLNRKLVIMNKLIRAFPWSLIFIEQSISEGNKGQCGESEVKQYYHGIFAFLSFLDACRHYGIHANRASPEQPGKEVIKNLEALYEHARIGIKRRYDLKEYKIGGKNVLKDLTRIDNKGLIKSCHYQLRCLSTDKIERKFLISRSGIIFFTSLWLDRSQAVNWLKQNAGFKGIDPEKVVNKVSKKEGLNEQRATIELFRYHSIRMPRPKIEPQRNDTQLLLDMLGELHRCPKELYERLENENKIKFIQRQVELETDEMQEMIEDESDGISKMVRSKNRTPYFAVRYLDDHNILEGYKFHINLGKFVFQKKEKNYKDEFQNRYLDQYILKFGHPTDFPIQLKEQIADVFQIIQDESNSSIKSISDDQTDLIIPYWKYAINHYHFSGNQIGIKRITTDNVIGQLQLDKKGKLKAEKPDAFLSNDALVPLAFYEILKEELDEKNINYNSEKIISDFIDSFWRLVELIETNALSDVLKEHENPSIDVINNLLRENDLYHWYGIIPNQLKTYFIDHTHHKKIQLAEHMLKIEITKTEEWQNKIDQSKKYVSGIKNQYQRAKEYKANMNLNAGSIATKLMKDILKFVPEAEAAKDSSYNNKPNGIQHDMMQREIAYFVISKEDFVKSCKEFKVIDSEFPHPFLTENLIIGSNNNLDFCIQYLTKKLTYLEDCLKEKDFTQYYYLRKAFKEKGHENFIQQVRRNGFSVGIPKAYINLRIKELIYNNRTNDKIAGWEFLSDCNSDVEQLENKLKTSRLIRSLNLHLFGQEQQEFYSYNRSYSLINAIQNKANSKKRFFCDQRSFLDECNKLMKKPQFKKQIVKGKKQDGYLRERLLEDGVTMMMAKKQLKKINQELYGSIESQFKLQNVLKGGKEHIFSENLQTSILIKDENNFSFRIFALINIKNSGLFFGLRRNRLVITLANSLQSIAEESNITMELQDLNSELKRFESLRIEGLKMIREFERNVYAKHTSLFNKDNNSNEVEYDKSKHDSFLSLLLKENQISEEEKLKMNKIRNGFGHNEFKLFSKIDIEILSPEQIVELRRGKITILLKEILCDTYGKHVDLANYFSPSTYTL